MDRLVRGARRRREREACRSGGRAVRRVSRGPVPRDRCRVDSARGARCGRPRAAVRARHLARMRGVRRLRHRLSRSSHRAVTAVVHGIRDSHRNSLPVVRVVNRDRAGHAPTAVGEAGLGHRDGVVEGRTPV